MNHRGKLLLRRARTRLLVPLLLAILAGCTRDPNILKQKYFESGQRYFQHQKYREAAIEFQNAIQKDPRFAQAHYQLALCYLKERAWSSAYSELMNTVSLDSENRDAQIDLGNLLVGAGKPQEARDRADQLLKKDPTDAEALILRAKCDAAMGQLPPAIEEVRKAIQAAPDRAAFYLDLGVLQARSKDSTGAEQNYQKALSIDPHLVSASIALAGLYQQEQRWNDAEKTLRQAIAATPKDSLPRAILAALFLAQGKRGEAEQVMIQAKNDLKDDPNGYRMLADFYLSQGDWDKALPEFEAVSQQHPKDLAVKKSLAQVLIYKNQLDQATKLDTEILKANSGDVDGLILKGQILTASNRPSEAIPTLQGAVKNAPEDAWAHYHLGVAFSKTGDWVKAIDQWKEATRRQPAMADAYRGMGDAAMHTGDAALLKESSDAVIRLQPSSADGYVMRAIALLSQNEYAPAEADLQKAIQLAPQAPAPYTQLGNLRFVQKRYPEAEKLYEQALDRNPSTPGALQGLVRIALARKQLDKAIQRVRAQIARVPADSGYYLLLGRLLFDSHDLAGAETALEKAIQIDKANGDAALLLGEIQSGRGAMDQALATYQTGANQNSRDFRFYAAMASLEETRGNWQHAEQLYQKALDIQPDQPLAANNLAYLMLEHNGDKNLALALAQKARKGLPDLPSTADTLAWAYYQIGSYNSAIDLLKSAVEKAPENATYQYHLGMAYAKTNNLPQAKRCLQRVLQISPNFNQADEIRSILGRSSSN